MPKILKIILSVLLIIIIGVFVFLFVGKATPAEKINWGTVFSQKHAELMGLDWKENYLAILDDLQIKNLKLIAYWDLIEKEPGVFDFTDIDWQINEADKRGAKILLVIGRKVPRWPECHMPQWIGSLDIESQKIKTLEMVERIVSHYKNSPAIKYWQVENEPLYPFGECVLLGDEFLKQEIKQVKSLDNRPVVISDSGEYSLWFKAAKLGDVLGFTLYKNVWFKELKRHVTYPFPAIYYNRKAWLIKEIFNKSSICVELQAEPWGSTLLYDSPLEEQAKSMNLEKFKKIIQFAKNTGTDTFYLWGSEWWYWMKTKQNQPEIWDEVKSLLMQ
ncbi:MAG: hypothetical protein NTY11_01120 [Candidatus Parcubacteria bacterium]|nr:hypothetical protein [Candidatus Parcubacteria bacterium]